MPAGKPFLQMNSFRYKAFISYSHRDDAWGSWLHRALETYKVPKRLVGTPGRDGPVPDKLYPVFRDRDEFSSSADLSEKVREALKESESLVVVCSPSAAQSRWVNEEIRLFRSLGRGDRIFSVIVAGDPQATDAQEQCFPPALMEADDGLRHEPLAADVRKWADGRSLARLKLVSAILGLRLADLRQREQRRKIRFRLLGGLAAVTVIALLINTVASKLAEQARMEAAEALVTQLVAVSADLDNVVDLETLRGISERLASYLETLDQNDLSNESRMQVAMVLRQLGQVSRSQGRPAEAMDAFIRSRDALAALVADAGEDRNALFELGQAEFWVGYIHLDKGEWDAAITRVNRYLDIGRQLFELEPNNAEWAIEIAYALGNLGTIESRRVPVNHEQVLEYMTSSMEYNRVAVGLAPDDDYYRGELAASHANLADAWLEVCNLGAALTSRMANVEFAEQFARDDPANNRFKLRHAFSLSGLAAVQRQVGLKSLARENLQKSVELLSELARQDPSNLTYRWNLQRKAARVAYLAALEGRLDEAWAMSASIDSEMRKLLQEDQSVSVVNATDFATFLVQYADLAHRRGDKVLSARWLDEGISHLAEIVRERPDYDEAVFQLRVAIVHYWQHHDQRLPEDDWLSGYADHRALEGAMSCKDISLAMQLAALQGDLKAANEYTGHLMGRGFYEPGFTRFCAEQGLCNN
jgi:tetratricopeptide (TPR) repeat protein